MLKEQLYKHCKKFVHKKLQTIQEIIQSNQNALESESKSSAGDKHETGRAMLQLEMEKAGQQLQEVQQMKLLLEKVDIHSTSEVVHLGTLVKTNLATYFIAISAGQIQIDDTTYFAISPNSPIGKQLLGKKVYEKIKFNGKEISIESLV